MSTLDSGQTSPGGGPDSLDFGPTIRGLVAGQKVFGRYALVRMLGRGGMGVVWLARDEHLEVEIALKFLPEVVALDRGAIDDMKRETRRSRELAHRSIVKVHQFELEPERELSGISMEFIDGDTLANLKIDQPGRCFSHTQLAPWLRELCDALDYAHFEAQMVHRDLKPANVMLDGRGRIKIADFGIASSIAESVSQLSVQRGSSGTPPYMSPQQAAGKPSTALDDVYSLGATIYDLLTGKPPFFSGNIQHQVENMVPPPMSERRLELKNTGEPIPMAWEETIAACLDKDPSRRPQSAGEVLEGLGITSAGTPWGRPRNKTMSSVEAKCVSAPNTISRRKRRILLAAGLAILLAGGSLAGWWFGAERPKQKAASVAGPTQMTVAAQPEKTLAATATPEQPSFDERVKAAAAAQVAEEKRKGEEAAALEAKKKEEDAQKITNASKEHPWENSLGMKFVPVGGTEVLFSIWDTRVQDYKVFVQTTGRKWRKPDFEQGPTHPAVNVSWEDAKAFCVWLTEKEQRAGTLGRNSEYRLPTDAEWSVAVGLGQENGNTPKEKQMKIKDVYPWGKQQEPPNGAGNYTPFLKVDDYKNTSPVEHFPANNFGLHDMGGNVTQWCEDWYDESKTQRVVRGASFDKSSQECWLSSWRPPYEPFIYGVTFGFRCVLVVGSSR